MNGARRRREEEPGIERVLGFWWSENAEDLQADDHDQRHAAEPKDDAFHDRGLRCVDRPLHWRSPQPRLEGETSPCAWVGAYSFQKPTATCWKVLVLSKHWREKHPAVSPKHASNTTYQGAVQPHRNSAPIIRLRHARVASNPRLRAFRKRASHIAFLAFYGTTS